MKAKEFYSAGLYLRLSRDDSAMDADSGRTESISIGSQRELLRSFVRSRRDMEIYDTYVDDGYSGINFDRPGFKRMMEDVRAGKVDCIIVKDDCVIKARTPQTLENRHFLRIGTEFRAIQRPQRAAYHIETS